MRVLITVLMLLGLSACACFAAEEERWWQDRLELGGWVETIQSMRLKSPNDSLTSRAKLRLELATELDWLYGFFSADAEKNWEIASETGVDLQEAWIEHVADNWDLRIGRQIIIWGKADGIQVTDMISPPDYTESITRDLDEIRMPVDAAKFRWLGDSLDTELIWIPVFKAAIRPSGDNPWAVQSDDSAAVTVYSDSTEEPDTTLENSEIALKVSGYLSGLDIAASAFYTWDDSPAYHRHVEYAGNGSATITYQPEHHRLTVFGLEGSSALVRLCLSQRGSLLHGALLRA
ncbi:DUF1302 family protein [uncultured Desulfuromusa sp.]|uniref:DUF1302 family protein n=1 Tax=uncultured Desulfuromusa sp. TaxID=219183 RepID=UPI002AA73FE3|nr:DUF1302 family protein [uncultured Desulfuromusa sp.]